jgi:hypothetical protein
MSGHGAQIEGKDIDCWADRPDAEHILPELVRRLLWAARVPL